jgi:hypothetical protein
MVPNPNSIDQSVSASDQPVRRAKHRPIKRFRGLKTNG